MKPFPKLTHSVRLVTLFVVFGLPAIASPVPLGPRLFAYDGPNQAKVAYDGRTLSPFKYDSADVYSSSVS